LLEDMLPGAATLPAQADIARLAETLVGLANGRGGALLLQLGALAAEEAADRVREACLLAAPVLILPRPRPVPERSLLLVSVPRGMAHVFSVDGRFLLRDGDINRPLRATELRRLLIERGAISFEEELQPDTTINDLDWATVEQYAAQAAALHESPFDLLQRRGCLIQRDGKLIPTNAGILLFGKDPQRFIRGAVITAARFAGAEMGDVFTRQDVGGTLPDQVRRAETFMLDHLRKDVRLRATMERAEQLEYPMEAARELVVNAVAHRDYSIQGDDIRLFVFADRLEVTSPGRLPGPVTLDNIVDERFSRNPVIVQVLSDLGFIERLGYGVDRVIALMKLHDLPAPEFAETSGGFRARLFNNLSLSDATPSAAWPLIDPAIALNARQEAALRFLSQRGNTRITNSDLQGMFPAVHAETLRRDLADLVSKGLLFKRGAKRGSYYVLAK
jgi:ATP-dependent DNA helicase RecG